MINNILNKKRVNEFPVLGAIARYSTSVNSSVRLSGNYVIQLDDLSGNGNHLTEVSVPPTLVTNNGIPYIAFTDNKRLLKAITISQPYTVIAVHRVKSYVRYSQLYRFNTHTEAIAQNEGNAPNESKSVSIVAGAGWAPQWNNYHPNVKKVEAFIFNGTSCQVVGDKSWSIKQNSGNNGAVKVSIGTNENGSCPDFDFYDFVIFGKVLTDTEIILISDYYRKLHNITSYVPGLLRFGDSIATGAAATGLNGFAQQLMKYMNCQYLDLAVPGTGLAYIESIYQYYLTRSNPATIWMIATMTNDFNGNTTAQDIVNWGNQYKTICQNIINSGHSASNILAVTAPYSSSRVTNNNLALTQLNILKSELGISVADCLAPTLATGQSMADGTHPGDEWMTLMLNACKTALI